MFYFLKNDFESCFDRIYYNGKYIDLFCVILVIIVDIWVIKKGFYLINFMNVDDLDDVIEIKEVIILNEIVGF